MKMRRLIILSILIVFLTGCGSVGGQLQVHSPTDVTPTETPTPDLQSTIVALQAQQTLAAGAMNATLTAIAEIPTATCPPCAIIVPAATATPPLVPPTPVRLGSISGALSYPSQFIPPLRIVAFNLTLDEYFYIQTERNTFSYTIANLPAGTYILLAYPRTVPGEFESSPDFYAGYSQAVPCGLLTTCTDHSLIQFSLADGENKTGIGPGDWYVQDPFSIGWPRDPLLP